MTFRFRGHVGHRWDEDVGVKRKEDLDEWLEYDPLKLERENLLSGDIAESEINAIDQDIIQKISDSIEIAKISSFPEKGILDYVFVEK